MSMHSPNKNEDSGKTPPSAWCLQDLHNSNCSTFKDIFVGHMMIKL